MLDHMYFFDVSRLTDLFIRNFFYKQQKHSPGCQLETSVVTRAVLLLSDIFWEKPECFSTFMMFSN